MDVGSMAPLMTVLTVTSLALAGGSSLLLLVAAAQMRIGALPRSSAPPWLLRAVGALGLTLALTSPAAATGSRRSDHPLRSGDAVAAPWFSAGGNPPPRLPAGTRVLPPWERTSVHPAIHGSMAKASGPLFPRAVSPVGSDPEPCAEKRACMARHPSGKAVPSRNVSTYTVQAGDTLWSIAGHVLNTTDIRAIARYWPRIHRANRAVIGAQPDLIFPGQVLELPPRS